MDDSIDVVTALCMVSSALMLATLSELLLEQQLVNVSAVKALLTL